MTRSPKKWRRLLDLATRLDSIAGYITMGRHVQPEHVALFADLRETIAQLNLQPVQRPMVRTGDPSTSAAAAEQIKAKLGQLQRRVLQAYREHHRLSARQAERLPEFARYGFSTIRKRISELAAAGLIVEDGVEDEHGPSASTVYALSEAGEATNELAAQAFEGAL